MPFYGSDIKETAEYYTRMQIQTASENRKIVMLHERVLSLIGLAVRERLNNRSYIIKGQNIISQLISSLKGDDSVSEGLYYLYEYIYVLMDYGDRKNLKNAEGILRVITEALLYKLRYP